MGQVRGTKRCIPEDRLYPSFYTIRRKCGLFSQRQVYRNARRASYHQSQKTAHCNNAGPVFLMRNGLGTKSQQPLWISWLWSSSHWKERSGSGSTLCNLKGRLPFKYVVCFIADQSFGWCLISSVVVYAPLQIAGGIAAEIFILLARSSQIVLSISQ